MKALIALSLAAALAAPALAVAAAPATSPEVIKQFPTTLTDAGKQFLDRCSDEQLAAATDPLIESSRCQALYKPWFVEADAAMRRETHRDRQRRVVGNRGKDRVDTGGR